MDFWILLAAALTLIVWSFLYRENPAFRFVEHLMVGLSAAYLFVGGIIYIKDYIATTSVLLWVWPIVLGLMMLGFFTKRYLYLYRIPMGFLIGVGSALTIRAVGHSQLLQQMAALVRPLIGATPLDTLNNVLIFVGTLTSLLYFVFTRERKGGLYWSSRVGRIFIMVTLGALFGRVASSRFAVDISRIKDIVTTDGVYLIPVFFILLLVLIVYDRRKGSKPPPSPADKASSDSRTS